MPTEESQQPTCPQVRHSRRCTHRMPSRRHSSQPCGVRAWTTFSASRRWSQAPARLTGVVSSSSTRRGVLDAVEHRFLGVDGEQRLAQHLVVVDALVACLEDGAALGREHLQAQPVVGRRGRFELGLRPSELLPEWLLRVIARSRSSSRPRAGRPVAADLVEHGEPGPPGGGDQAAPAARPRRDRGPAASAAAEQGQGEALDEQRSGHNRESDQRNQVALVLLVGGQ